MSLIDDRVTEIKEALIDFFMSVYENINNPEKTIFVAVTRKGYWLYKNIEKELQKSFREKNKAYDKILIYSDRYLLKDFHFDTINNKYVILFDDSINNGNNLFYFYTLFLKHGALEVYPCVFAMSTEYIANRNLDFNQYHMSKYLEYERVYKRQLGISMTEQEMWCKSEKLYKEFNRKINYGKIMSVSEISKFSICQLLLAQRKLSPFAMDLPMICREKETDVLQEYIEFSKEEWEKITEKTREWEYVYNTYDELEEEINCDYFRLKDRLLDEQFEDTFFDFVVKCKHVVDGEKVKAIFVPFALVKSFSYEDVWQCFIIMFSDTKYYDFIMDFLHNPKENLEQKAVDEMMIKHNFGRAIIRAVIYYISLYIGGLFKEMVNKQTGKELVLNEEIMSDHNICVFNQTVLQLWENFNKDDFLTRLFKCRKTKAVTPINVKQMENEDKNYADSYEIEQYIHFRIIETKYVNVEMKKKLLTIETIEQEVDKLFRFESMDKRKAAITKAILLLLETSCLGNELILDNSVKTIYRGFRAGESSEILFRKSFFWSYVYAYVLYYLKGIDGYRKNILNIMDNAERYLIREGYMGTIISEKEFEMYKEYLVKMKNPHEQIPSKTYMIDKYENTNSRYGEKIFIKQASEAVLEWIQ